MPGFHYGVGRRVVSAFEFGFLSSVQTLGFCFGIPWE